MKIDNSAVYIPSSKVITRKIEGELIIVPIQDGVADMDDAMFSLNETGQAVWERLAPEKTVDLLCCSLADEFNASVEEIKKDVLDLLGQLYQKSLIVKYGKN